VRVLYDLKNQPLTFDITTFLAFITLLSGTRGSTVEFILLADSVRKLHEMELVHTPEMDRWRVENIFMPLLVSARSIRGFSILFETPTALPHLDWPPKFNLEWRNNSPPSSASLNHPTIHGLYKLYPMSGLSRLTMLNRSTKLAGWFSQLSKNRKFLSVTVRYSRTGIDRNTSSDELEGVLDEIDERFGDRVTVFVIGDQDGVMPTELEDAVNRRRRVNVVRCMLAEWNLAFRVHIYQNAVANIAWNTGPASLLFFSDYPYISFGTFTSTAGVSNLDFLMRKGPAYNQQPPWGLKDGSQVVDWTDGSMLDYTSVRQIVSKYFDGVNLRDHIN
jgi:hypothetical protein